LYSVASKYCPTQLRYCPIHHRYCPTSYNMAHATILRLQVVQHQNIALHSRNIALQVTMWYMPLSSGCRLYSIKILSYTVQILPYTPQILPYKLQYGTCRCPPTVDCTASKYCPTQQKYCPTSYNTVHATVLRLYSIKILPYTPQIVPYKLQYDTCHCPPAVDCTASKYCPTHHIYCPTSYNLVHAAVLRL